MISSNSVAVFVCLSKACAPPPVGKGGSTKASQAAWTEARKLAAHAASKEGEITKDISGIARQFGGSMTGLKHRVKGLKSLARKIHDKAVSKGISVEESAARIPDALRYTAKFPTKSYSSSVKRTLAALEKKGYKVHELETHWTRGDAYNGIHAVMIHPNGTKIELQFHTPRSFAAKMKTHSMYETFRKATTTPQERTRLTREMIDIADSAEVPRGANDIGQRIFRPVE